MDFFGSNVELWLSVCLEDAKRYTIYEYHRVEIDSTKIISGSAFEFTPLPSELYTLTFMWQPCLIVELLTPEHCVWSLQLVFNTQPVTSAWHPTWQLAAAGATQFNGRMRFWKMHLEWNRGERRSLYFVFAEFQVLWWYWPAQTRVVRLQLPWRGETISHLKSENEQLF